ncbi:MAG: lysostaphin resistance A-like protein [Bdellovibrio bacteriovorus]
MRTTALFFGFLVLCLATAALLTVPLMQTGWVDYPPERVMGRLTQALILIGIWPLLLRLQLADLATLGYGTTRPRFLRSLGVGWVLGVLILLGLALALLGLGVRVPDPDPGTWSWVARKAALALVGGLMIGILEETFFRGALYTAIRRREGLVPAVLWSSGLYAVLHLMKPGALPTGVPFDWSGGWTMLQGVFLDALQWRHLDTALALGMVGVFLALVRERTGHIGWCIGLHAGWVFVIQVSRRLTDGNPESDLAFLAGDYDGVIGWLALAWIGVLTAGYWHWGGRRPIHPRPPPA